MAGSPSPSRNASSTAVPRINVPSSDATSGATLAVPQRSSSIASFRGDQDYFYCADFEYTIAAAAKKDSSAREPADSTHVTNNEEFPEDHLTYEKNVWQRLRAERRAQLPDLGLASPNLRNVNPQPGHHINMAFIELDWTKEDEKLCVTHGSIKSIVPQGNIANQVIWTHCQHDALSLDKFKDLAHRQSHIFSQSDVTLTERLMFRIQRASERQMIGQSFLEPVVGRYDSRDPSGKIADKSSIFVNFPYLEVQLRPKRKVAPLKDGDHGLRSLLRYQFGLSKTMDQDRDQSIVDLDSTTFNDSVKLASDDKSQPSLVNPQKLLIYVPQLWGLLIGAGILVTNGYARFADLKGPSIDDSKKSASGIQGDTPLIQISFKDSKSTVQNLVFPLTQCDCYYGLLNKHRQILEIILGKPFDRDTARNYGIFLDNTDEQIKGRDDWHAKLRDRPKRRVIIVWIKNSTNDFAQNVSNTDSNDQTADANGDGSPSSSGDANNKARKPGPVRHLVYPLLEWTVIDEYGHYQSAESGAARARLFLENICRSLPASITLRPNGTLPNQQTFGAQRSAILQQAASKTVAFAGKTESQATKRIERDIHERSITHHNSRCERLRVSTLHLLKLFLSEEMAKDSDGTHYVWGTIYLLIDGIKRAVQITDKDFYYLEKEISAIFGLAEPLHAGVYRERAAFEPRPVNKDKTISDGAILLKATVDAFGEILGMFIEVARIMKSTDVKLEAHPISTSAIFNKCTGNARRSLRLAASQLIVESDRIVQQNGLGPSATPEGIFIALLRRLSGGVYGTKQINITRIYDASLQKLASQIRKKPSQRLVQKINEVGEEIAIVRDVVGQQEQVLVDFRRTVDPAGYITPSSGRRLGFRYEAVAIDEILHAVRARIKDCDELRDRVRHLTEQNVQVLATLQDDNNKVLYAFTLVTILFLPSSFVAGFFGMNIKGVGAKEDTIRDFWVIAGSLTGAVVVACFVFAYMVDSIFAVIRRHVFGRLRRALRIVLPR